MTDIRGRVAFVTGGGGAIGGAIAKALAAEGAAVAVADILHENAHTVAKEITATGGTAAAVACDVTDRASIRHATDEANAALGGPVSLLVANAGVTSWQRLTEMSDNDVDWIFQTNLMGVVNCLRAVLPGMIEAGSGHVVATASTSGLRPGFLPYHTAYSSSKLGLIGLMFNLRHELAEVGIGTSVLIPAGVVSGLKENNARYRPERFGGPGEGRVESPEAVRKIFANYKKVYRPAEDVAQMVMLAVREDRPIILTDSYDRKIFQETYVAPLMTAFDEVDEFDRALRVRGGSQAPQPGERLTQR